MQPSDRPISSVVLSGTTEAKLAVWEHKGGDHGQYA